MLPNNKLLDVATWVEQVGCFEAPEGLWLVLMQEGGCKEGHCLQAVNKADRR